ncbi:glycosyltransferase [candidate division KSB1 bacterium]|nr:glycosyltransferase [candidate division KSB1 bacterium]NIS26855.1 glycosyltransferase [candidate division KSB1 bacterium]NIU27522.1 glycosyltransferase [candidate division KSB1 bacterium]NIU94108.1 glycosyltransferase [candidate division KSB1 bacterium]NIV96764.1 glycosyltransferase [candidate division KSB1 bacterium]
MAQATELSVIIVNYNVKEFLEQALISIKKALKAIPSEIIVVDNASSDGSVSLLRQKFPDVRIIENTKNLGFAKASNQGLRMAKGEFLVLLNPDTIVQADTFSRMIEFFNTHPDTGMLGCKILNPDGSLQLACRRSFPTPWVAFTRLIGLSYFFPKSKLFGKYNLTYLDPDVVCEVEAISGSFMMIRRNILNVVGYLDESFFLYGEDLDWCYRIRENGWKVRYFPGTQIIHFKGESSKRTEFDRLKAFYQAMIFFARKHFKQKYLLMPYWFLWIAIWIRAGFSFFIKFLRTVSMPLIDFSVLSLSLILGVYLWFGSFSHLASFVPIIVMYALVWLLTLNSFGCYTKHKFSSARAGLAILIGFFINASLLFFFKQFAYSRAWVLLGGVLSAVTVPGWRIGVKLLPQLGITPFKGTLGKTLLARNTIIVGESDSCKKLIRKLNSQLDSGYNVKGLVHIDGVPTGYTDAGIDVLGSLENLNTIIGEKRIQEVIFSTHELSFDQILNLISRSQNQRVNFKLVPSNLEVVIGKASIDRLEDVPLVDLDYRLHRAHHQIIKRTFDIGLALMLAVFSSPVYLYKKYIAENKLRKFSVLGEGGRPKILAEFTTGRSQFLNKLPYIWSILKGDMSFVGSEIVKLEDSLPSENSKLKPGITGLVQVNRHKQLSAEERTQYDIYYIKNYSPLLDLEIMLKAMFKL